MTTDLRDQLQSSLGKAYALDHELGGGGMSRVFVAREAALGRDVVVKVMRPDLAEGISADRFKREILLAAQLQQANIVPLLSAGISDGIPYYTMPFVEGESLRAKLSRDGARPIAEVVKILGEVARALAYAHDKGIVHRDIKPDNILLSGGTAVVTDFGIAKALTAARTDADALTALTSTGTSIGTPAYMAPEQAAGDPATDRRADLYALGVVAYELLAGQPPFHGMTPQKLLAAQMGQRPQPVIERRPDCPPALAALVERLLEKEPELRPQSAAEVLQTLESVATTPGSSQDALPIISIASRRALARALGIYVVAFIAAAVLAKAAIIGIGLPDWVLLATLMVMALGLPAILFTAFVHHGSRVARTMAATTPGGSPTANSTLTRLAVKASPFVTWRRTTMGGVAAVLALVLLVTGYMTLRALGIGPAGSLFVAGKLGDRDRVLVADFTAPAADSGLGIVVGEAVRTNLAQSRAVTVAPASFVAAALARMQRPKTSRLDLELAREIAQREGVKAVVHGDVTPLGTGYIVTLRLLNAESGDELASVRETADSPHELIPAIDKVTRALRGRMGESLKTVRASPSLVRVTTSSLPALRKYTEAYRATYFELDFEHSVAAAEEAIRLDSTFAMAYRLAALNYGDLGRRRAHRDSLRKKAYDLRDRLPEAERAQVEAAYFGLVDRQKALQAYERALSLDPMNTTVMNQLGLSYFSQRDYAKSEAMFRRALAVGDGTLIPRTTIIATLIAAGKFVAAESAIVAATAGRSVHSLEDLRAGELAWNRHQYDSAARLIARAAVTNPDAFGDIAAGNHASIAAARGQFGEFYRLRAQSRERNKLNRSDTAAAFAAVLDSLSFYLWIRNDSAAVLRRLDALVASEPTARSNPQVLFLYARAGNASAARAVLTRHDAALDSTQKRFESSLHGYWSGEIALAEGHLAEAIAHFRRADSSYDHRPIVCSYCLSRTLALAFDRQGVRDSAITYMERYLDTPTTGRIDSDAFFLPYFRRRLGEMYEEKGDRVRAATNYRAFIELWKNADPVAQPRVREAKLRLSRLTDTEARR